MKIAIFDHLVTERNAIGKCHLELLTYLADDHEFTVFALEFDNPRPDRIKFVKVPALRRPLLGLMISFHIIAPFVLWWYRQIKGEKFDLVQAVGGNFLLPDLAYGHFCHRVYLNDHKDARPTEPIRRLYSWIYDSIVSMLEPYSYGHARYIVTPSSGLAGELERQFQTVLKTKPHVISNPVSVKALQAQPDQDLRAIRADLNITDDDLVMIFVAAGHFDRKGLPLLLEAMVMVQDPRLKLLVVGGTEAMIKEYSGSVTDKNLDDQVQFVGFQNDIREYLWASDMFVFPSAYETFSLVSFEAAGAGLPLLVAPLYGVEDLLVEGYNGWQVERDAKAFADKMRFGLENRATLKHMGQNALDSVKHYSPEAFGEEWKSFYRDVAHRQREEHHESVSGLSSGTA